jgi:cytoskeletal protein CcmA (bactofilin family)
MWGDKKEPLTPMRENTPQPAPPIVSREPARDVRAPEPARDPAPRGGIATIGKSLVIKGTISGTEDLYIDGEVEGAIELKDNNITVGPNGRVNAGLHARDIVVLGRVKGNVRAIERLEIRKVGSLIGDIITARVVIEDGAYFKGSIDIQKGVTAPPTAPAAPAPAAVLAVPAGTPGAPAASTPAAASASASGGSTLGEPKKF